MRKVSQEKEADIQKLTGIDKISVYLIIYFCSLSKDKKNKFASLLFLVCLKKSFYLFRLPEKSGVFF